MQCKHVVPFIIVKNTKFIYALRACEVQIVCSTSEESVYWKYSILMEQNKSEYLVGIQHVILNRAIFQSGNKHTIVCIMTKIVIPTQIFSKRVLRNNFKTKVAQF
jgi:hypothetical protein